jgi:endonuclease/exonuclease/phosphatase family metal-dependent hydrolase
MTLAEQNSASRMNRLIPVIALVLLAAIGLGAPAVADAATRPKPPSLRVMTRNLYLGTDPIPIAVSPNLNVFEQRAQRGFENVKETDFPARAKLLAREIKRTKPDLIGLQEVALWRTGPKDGVMSNETTVAFDWLALLRKELKDLGLRYRLGGVQPEFDLSGPTADDFDVRLTMRDAILMKKRNGLAIRGKRGGNFQNLAQIPIPALGTTVTIKRGWVYDDLKLRGRRFRFLNTHLEAYGDSFRLAQANELIASGGPARSTRPVILVGDLNSDPNGDPNGTGDPAPYNAITGFGFLDTWKRLYPGNQGYECCLDHQGAGGLPDLMDPPPFPADHRIDHVLRKGKRLKPVSAKVVGTDPTLNRTASGLWESDHGGVVTKFRLK